LNKRSKTGNLLVVGVIENEIEALANNLVGTHMNISIDFNHKFKMKIKTVINSIQVL
jgi:hypothetical protein